MTKLLSAMVVASFALLGAAMAARDLRKPSRR